MKVVGDTLNSTTAGKIFQPNVVAIKFVIDRCPKEDLVKRKAKP